MQLAVTVRIPSRRRREPGSGSATTTSGTPSTCGRIELPRTDISLHVDHDHGTGELRKLLCFDCNAGIGKFREDPDLLRAAVTYLFEHDPEMVELGVKARARLVALHA